MKGYISLVFIIFHLIYLSCSKLDIVREPKIGTDTILTIQQNSAIIKAKIIDAGTGFEAYGHCWSKNQNPTVSDSITDFGTTKESIQIVSHLKNLEPNTKYFIRHFFYDGQNYQYGPESYFTTSTSDNFTKSLLEISEISPSDNAIDIALDEKVVIKFNKDIDTNTINEYNIYLQNGSEKVNSSIAYSASSYEIQLTPDSILRPDTEYEIVVTEYIQATDESNMEMHIFSFTTTSKAMLDIVYTSPNNNAIDVSLGDSIFIGFSNSLDINTINESNIYISDGLAEVSYNYIYNDDLNTLTIIPSSNLLPNTQYEVVVTNGLRAIDNSYMLTRTFNFTTINSIFLNDGLIAYYTFDNNAFDYSGNANHCIEYSNEVYVQGVNGMAHDFNGFSDYLQLTNTLDASNGLSFSFWIFTEEAVAGEKVGAVISKYNMQYDYHSFYVLCYNAWVTPTSYYLGTQFYTGVDTERKDDLRSSWETLDSIPELYNRERYTIVNPQYLNINEWVHCVINYTDTEVQAWINGVLTIKKLRDYQTYYNTNLEPTYIGNNLMSGEGDNNHFHGALDEFRIYNRELTEDEIQALYLE